MRRLVSKSGIAVLPAVILTLSMGCTSGRMVKALPQPELIRLLREGGQVIYMRHPKADVGFDTPRRGEWWKGCGDGYRMLSDSGRADAVRVGEAIRRLRIPIHEVLCSEYCRTVETARLLALGEPKPDARLNHWRARLSVDPENGHKHMVSDTRSMLATKPAEGNVLLVSHKQDFRGPADLALADLRDGECAVYTPDGRGGYALRGRIQVSDWAKLEAAGP